MNSPDKNIGVDSHALLQGIVPTQGFNPDLLHCRRILYCLNHQGNTCLLLGLFPSIFILLQLLWYIYIYTHELVPRIMNFCFPYVYTFILNLFYLLPQTNFSETSLLSSYYLLAQNHQLTPFFSESNPSYLKNFILSISLLIPLSYLFSDGPQHIFQNLLTKFVTFHFIQAFLGLE